MTTTGEPDTEVFFSLAVIGLASGHAGGAVISDPSSPEAQKLEAALTAVLQGGWGASALKEGRKEGREERGGERRRMRKSVVVTGVEGILACNAIATA